MKFIRQVGLKMLEEVSGLLKKRLKGKRFGLIGVGNSFRMDDGAGPRLIELLAGKVSFPLVDASEVPENYSSWIIKKALDVVIFVDAVGFDGEPGEVRFIPIDDLMVSASSTHRLSLHFMIKYMKQQWSGEAILIGIQPARTDLENELSPAVGESVKRLAKIFIEIDSRVR